MNERHIIDIIDATPNAALAPDEVKMIRAHIKDCESCRHAYEAAQLSAAAIRARATQPLEPSPFFQTRVLAAWREQQAIDNVPVLWRLWKATGALVASMAVITAALATLTFISPGVGSATSSETTAALIPNSAETVVLDQNQANEQMTDDQVLNAIYADDDAR